MPNLSDFKDIKVGSSYINNIYQGGNLIWEWIEPTFPETNMVSYYKLDENANDEYGSNDLIQSGTTIDDDGLIEKCMLFSNTSDRIEASDDTIFSFNKDQEFSFSIWIYPTSLSANTFILSKGNNAADYEGYHLYIDGTQKLMWYIKDDSGNILSVTDGGYFSTLNKWYHIVASYDGSGNEDGIKLYVDGYDRTTHTSTDTLSGDITGSWKFNIGNRDGGNLALNCKIDEVGIWDKELTSDEVYSLFNRGNGLTYTNPTPAEPVFPVNGLLGYYKMDGDGFDQCEYASLTATNVTWEAGKIENAGNFTSSDSRLEASASEMYNFEITDTFSFSFWVKLNSTGDETLYRVFSKDASVDGKWLIGIVEDKVYLKFKDTSGGQIEISTDPLLNSTDVWYNIIITHTSGYNASNFKIYLNGININNIINSDNLTTSILNSHILLIGNYYNNIGQNLHGLLDEVGIWSRVLTQEEVTTLYNDGNGLTYTPEIPRKSLVAWYGDYVNKGIDRNTYKGGDAITQWDDIVGKVKGGYDLDHTTGTITYDLNDKALYFDGNSTIYNSYSYNIGSKLTIFAVFTPIDKTAINDLIFIGTAGGGSNYYNVGQRDDGTDNYVNLSAGSNGVRASNNFENNVQYLISTINTIDNDVKDSIIKVNGIKKTNDVNNISDTFTSSFVEITIGGYNQTNGRSIMNVSELIIYDRALDDCEISQVENYLATKYGIEVPVKEDPYYEYLFENSDATNTGSLGTDYNLLLVNQDDDSVSTDVSPIVKQGYIDYTNAVDAKYGLMSNAIQRDILYKQDSFTLSVWVKNTDLTYSGFGTPIGVGFDNGNDEYTSMQFFFRHKPLNSGDRNWYLQTYDTVSGGGVQVTAPNNSAYTTDYTLLTAITDPTTVFFYINDVLIGSVALGDMGNGLYSGGYYITKMWTNSLFWNTDGSDYNTVYQYRGKIFKPRWYKYAMQECEVQNMYKTEYDELVNEFGSSSILDNIVNIWTDSNLTLLEKLNAIYDLIVDLIQAGLTEEQINSIIDWLQDKKNGQNQQIIDRINNVIQMLIDALV